MKVFDSPSWIYHFPWKQDIIDSSSEIRRYKPPATIRAYCLFSIVLQWDTLMRVEKTGNRQYLRVMDCLSLRHSVCSISQKCIDILLMSKRLWKTDMISTIIQSVLVWWTLRQLMIFLGFSIGFKHWCM